MNANVVLILIIILILIKLQVENKFIVKEDDKSDLGCLILGIICVIPFILLIYAYSV